MASVTQTIPSFIAGISQQPDDLKRPGQVKEAINVIPDVTYGLTKRPGGRLIGSLSDGSLNSSTNGRWFSYYRDEAEQYIGQIYQNGTVRMWKCSDGSEKSVVVAHSDCTDYLTHTGDESIQTLTLNDHTYLVNREKTTAMTNTVEPTRPYEAFVELKQIAYSSQYALNISNDDTTQDVSTATRISISYSTSDSGSGNAVHTSGTCNSVGTQLFKLSDTGKDNLFIRIVAMGQPTTDGGENPTYKCRYTITTDLLYGGEGWVAGNTKTVTMTDPVQDTNYTITIDESSTSKVKANLALVRPTPTPFDKESVVTAESILGDVREGITGSSTSATGNGFTVQQIGSGLYITRTDGAFTVQSPNSELMGVLTSEVNTVEDLPRQCKHGYVVKVKNSDSTQDDYYVKFFGVNNKDGPGVWEECPAPGRKIEIDPATMPMDLIRTADGNFRLAKLDASTYTVGGTSYTTHHWRDCPVGDTLTSPEPSFIGRKINRLLFFRNRLVILAENHIIMSRPSAFFDFWIKSAITYSAVDSIDVSASSEQPADLYDGIEITTGLILFSQTKQFLVATDSDVLSPETVKVNSLSNYNFNIKTNPISLGTTIGFLDNAGKYSRFMEAARVMREGEPQVVEQSKVVSKLFGKDLDLISNSRENGVVFFAEQGKSSLYGYRYFKVGEKHLQQAWFEWELPGTIQHHTVLDDSLYVVLRGDGNKDVMHRYDIRLGSGSRTVTDDMNTESDTTDDIEYRLHIDNSKVISASSLGYSSTTGKTGFTKPNGFNFSDKQLVVYTHTSSPNGNHNNVGRYALASVVGNNIEWVGDFTGNDLIVGYLFDMKVKIPTIYHTKQMADRWVSDTRASLVVHRLKLNLGASGSYSTLIERTGKPDYTQLFEAPKASGYQASDVGILEQDTQAVPIYERNKNLTVTLKSTDPTPATLFSMSWEGDLSPKYYRNV